MRKFEAEIPAEYICSISNQIMSNPVLAEDGETYEKEEIEQYFAKQQEKAHQPEVSTKKLSNNSLSAPASIQITSPLHGTSIGTKLTPNLGIMRQIKRFLEDNPQLADEELYFEQTIIADALSAIQLGDEIALKRLIEKEKRLLTKKIVAGKNLLEVVCKEGSSSMLIVVLAPLVKSGNANFNGQDLKELLLLCQENMGKSGIECFLDAINWTSEQRAAFFKVQVSEGNDALVGPFIERGLVDIDAPLDTQNNTAAHIAILNNQIETLKLLIALGADIKLTNDDDLNIKALAAKHANKKLVRQISQWRHEKKSAGMLQIIAQLQEDNTLLHKSVSKLHDALLKTQHLLTEKAKHEPENFVSHRFFGSYIRQQNDQELKLIRELFQAISQWDLAKVTDILNSSKSVVYRPNDDGVYPLVAAAYSAHSDIFNLICQKITDKTLLNTYLLMIDINHLAQNVQRLTPQIRPENATYGWLADWYQENANQIWRQSYNTSVELNRAVDNSDWADRKKLWFLGGQLMRTKSCRYSRDASGRSTPAEGITAVTITQSDALDPDGIWAGAVTNKRKGSYTECYYGYTARKTGLYSEKEQWQQKGWKPSLKFEYEIEYTKDISQEQRNAECTEILYLPDPGEHDQFVAGYVEKFQKLNEYICTLVAEARTNQVNALNF